jgi:hypothetical protein
VLYMVIEHFNGNARAVYERFGRVGRLMPAGLEYVDSWVERDLSRCFQLMRTDDPRLLEQWANNWSDLVTCEFIPLISGKDAAAIALR